MKQFSRPTVFIAKVNNFCQYFLLHCFVSCCAHLTETKNNRNLVTYPVPKNIPFGFALVSVFVMVTKKTQQYKMPAAFGDLQLIFELFAAT